MKGFTIIGSLLWVVFIITVWIDNKGLKAEIMNTLQTVTLLLILTLLILKLKEHET